jgi:hypothetical protein
VPLTELEPTLVVTTTSTTPALERAGAVAVIVELLTTTTLVAETEPNVTVAGDAKFVPEIVTDVPEVFIGVLAGERLVTTGALSVPLKVNWVAVLVGLVPAAFVTVTWTMPAPMFVGVAAVIWVGLT